MYLITEKLQSKIAEEDIIVYKLLKIEDNVIKAPYEKFVYEPKKLYKTELQKTYESNTFDTVTYLYYNNFSNYSIRKYLILDQLICIGPGFHAAFHADRYDRGIDEDLSIFECTIPAGSEYYEDSTGLLASNQIIINSKL